METRIEHDAVGEIGVVVHEGREYAARGATVTATYAAAYPGAGGVLQSWGGEAIGTWRVVASWPVRSYMGSTMYQIEARINGQLFTGRGFGAGMLWRGRLKAVQS
jgi:hypothetical protein